MDKEIDVAQVQALMELSDLARRFLESLANRSHNRRVTLADSVVKKFRANRRDVIELFKAMQDAGLGEFIVGRRQMPSRFKWLSRMTDVGRAAIGEADEIGVLEAADLEDLGEDEDEDSLGIDLDEDFLDCYDHTFMLRAGYEPITISLPKDLTAQEAERIATFVRALPMA